MQSFPTTAAQLSGPQVRLWVDTDITIGEHGHLLAFRDVDDGYALGLLMRSQEVELIGISSTLGNTDDIQLSTSKAKEFVRLFGPTSLSVYPGAAGTYLKVQQQSPLPAAVEALAEALKQGPLTILAIGALTNIALLLEHYPELSANIDNIISVAGRRHVDDRFISGWHQPKPFRDLNFEYDLAAYQTVLASRAPLTLIPFELCKQVWINFHDLASLGQESSLGHYLASRSEGWCAEWELIFGTKKGFNPFDMLAAAYAINPAWFKVKTWQAEVLEGPSDTTEGQTKPYLVCNEMVNSGREVNYAWGIDPSVPNILMARLQQHSINAFVLGLSHINVVVEDVDQAAAYYQRVLGFEPAHDAQGQAMDYRKVTMEQFNQDAGLAGKDVEVDVLFVKHPYADIYLELMKYHSPQGQEQIPEQAKTYDMGGPRHLALEVSNCKAVFDYLKTQPDVRMIDQRKDYQPEKLDGFPISFFYWIDRYGIQWEMEEGRRVGSARGII